jgi:hypothetical protein
MNNLMFRSIALMATLTAMSMASATIWNFSGLMDGSQENPPNGSPGFGSFSGTLDDITGAITLGGAYSGMLANVTAAHIHGPALPGVNGPVILPLTTSGGTAGTLNGAGTYTALQIADLLAGKHYVNVHTSAFPGGEIRGQITAVPEPGTLAAIGLGVAALARRRRSSR